MTGRLLSALDGPRLPGFCSRFAAFPPVLIARRRAPRPVYTERRHAIPRVRCNCVSGPADARRLGVIFRRARAEYFRVLGVGPPKSEECVRRICRGTAGTRAGSVARPPRPVLIAVHNNDDNNSNTISRMKPCRPLAAETRPVITFTVCVCAAGKSYYTRFILVFGGRKTILTLLYRVPPTTIAHVPVE